MGLSADEMGVRQISNKELCCKSWGSWSVDDPPPGQKGQPQWSRWGFRWHPECMSTKGVIFLGERGAVLVRWLALLSL